MVSWCFCVVNRQGAPNHPQSQNRNHCHSWPIRHPAPTGYPIPIVPLLLAISLQWDIHNTGSNPPNVAIKILRDVQNPAESFKNPSKSLNILKILGTNPWKSLKSGCFTPSGSPFFLALPHGEVLAWRQTGASRSLRRACQSIKLHFGSVRWSKVCCFFSHIASIN